MTDAEMLTAVKTALNISGTFQDATISGYISDVKGFLEDAGVKPEILADTASVGVISRGVADLWNYGSGNTKLSDYFFQRAKQLALRSDNS